MVLGYFYISYVKPSSMANISNILHNFVKDIPLKCVCFNAPAQTLHTINDLYILLFKLFLHFLPITFNSDPAFDIFAL